MFTRNPLHSLEISLCQRDEKEFVIFEIVGLFLAFIFGFLRIIRFFLDHFAFLASFSSFRGCIDQFIPTHSHLHSLLLIFSIYLVDLSLQYLLAYPILLCSTAPTAKWPSNRQFSGHKGKATSCSPSR